MEKLGLFNKKKCKPIHRKNQLIAFQIDYIFLWKSCCICPFCGIGLEFELVMQQSWIQYLWKPVNPLYKVIQHKNYVLVMLIAWCKCKNVTLSTAYRLSSKDFLQPNMGKKEVYRDAKSPILHQYTCIVLKSLRCLYNWLQNYFSVEGSGMQSMLQPSWIFSNFRNYVGFSTMLYSKFKLNIFKCP